MKIGRGTCQGTFGELLQGVLNERPFLVTLPIPALKSEATFIPDCSSSQVVGPFDKTKSVAACKKLLQLFEIDIGGTLMINSNIPEGKGMASSSADIVAAIRAVADSFDLKITEEIISEIASGIEPTDGVMYNDVVAYDYINGRLLENLGEMPDFGLIGVDLGGMVDTVQFNQIPKNYNAQDRKKFFDAYELIKLGIKHRDLSLICTASTISARINQRILPKPYFDRFVEISFHVDGGIIVGHSGNIMGILFNTDHRNEVISEISNEICLVMENRNVKRFIFLNKHFTTNNE
jgi:uncharacterized protein involved in propanediol utilization